MGPNLLCILAIVFLSATVTKATAINIGNNNNKTSSKESQEEKKYIINQ